jgi:L-cysteine/cystine lyase
MPLTLETIREELPVTQTLAYLNSGTAGPLPRRTTATIMAAVERQMIAGRSDFKVFMEEIPPLLTEVRTRFARLLGAGEDEIALTHHTTEGMNIAVWGQPWQRGDEIVTTTIEHEGGLMPVYVAAQRLGLTLRVVNISDNRDVVSKLAAVLNARTRLVVLSHVSWRTGYVLPVREIAAAVHQAGALLAVDGAQAAGVVPLNMAELDADYYAIPGQKWLLGPEGFGAFVVRRTLIPSLAPTFVGYFTKRDIDASDDTGYFIPPPGARRYEVGTVYWPALDGLRYSLRWLEESVGHPFVFERTAEMTRRCRQLLAALPGVTVHSPEQHSGLTTFSLGDGEAMPIVEALAARGVVIRSLPHSNHLRVSTGFFNTDEDLQRLREGLLAVGNGATATTSR